jgi:UTP--glucose-1-phosphate uridylyltransferase
VEANVAFALWRSDMNQNMAGVIRTLLDELKPSERRGAAF